MKLGIVGLPNVGKSTLFNAITNAGAAADNYPFCTIDPNVGVVSVPDERLDSCATSITPRRTPPSLSLSTSRVWSRARGRARVSATSSCRTSAARRHRPRRALLRRFKHHPRRAANTNVPVDPLRRHRHHQHRAHHGRPRDDRPPHRKGQKNAKGATSASTTRSRSSRPCATI